MNENLQITIKNIELLRLQFNTHVTKQDEETDLKISYEISDTENVDFTIHFTYNDEEIRVEGTYLFSIIISKIKKASEFIEKEKEQLIYPVYTKISGLIYHLSDQTLPFPLVIPPSIWLDDNEDNHSTD